VAQKTNILLVDDDATVRQSIGHALVSENYGVVHAADEREALHQFGLNQIDILLLDVNLGEESGWETLQKLRALRPMLPAIVMSGYVRPSARPYPYPVQAFMEKPLDMSSLFRKLAELAAECARLLQAASNNGTPSQPIN
jgi:CheY-like chemotaxis protein